MGQGFDYSDMKTVKTILQFSSGKHTKGESDLKGTIEDLIVVFACASLP